MAKKTPLAEKLEEVRTRIATVCAKAKRDPSDVTLIAVTKTAAPEQIREIIQLGVADLGESRVQVLQQKVAQINEFHQRRVQSADVNVAGRLRWHMIGHLQRNKIKPVLPLVAYIHSVDSLRLAEEIDVAAEKMGRKVQVLLQVNTAEEQQKYGVAVGAALHLAEQMDTMPGVQIVGLMAMAPFDAAEPVVRQIFARTRELFEELKWQKIGGVHFKHLSMGMSNDFEAAILEGSTMVRIGSSLLGSNSDESTEDEEH